jgi:hypothetical protein
VPAYPDAIGPVAAGSTDAPPKLGASTQAVLVHAIRGYQRVGEHDQAPDQTTRRSAVVVPLNRSQAVQE